MRPPPPRSPRAAFLGHPFPFPGSCPQQHGQRKWRTGGEAGRTGATALKLWEGHTTLSRRSGSAGSSDAWRVHTQTQADRGSSYRNLAPSPGLFPLPSRAKNVFFFQGTADLLPGDRSEFSTAGARGSKEARHFFFFSLRQACSVVPLIISRMFAVARS